MPIQIVMDRTGDTRHVLMPVIALRSKKPEQDFLN
jgi:hypothetical protein